MSFHYPRTIAITRPSVQSGVGVVGYGGVQQSNETPVASGIQAAIQEKKEGGKPDARLPADASRRTYWKVLIPLAALANGTINDRDIVTDDLGARYQVISNYWNSLGYNLLCERLEA